MSSKLIKLNSLDVLNHTYYAAKEMGCINKSPKSAWDIGVCADHFNVIMIVDQKSSATLT